MCRKSLAIDTLLSFLTLHESTNLFRQVNKQLREFGKARNYAALIFEHGEISQELVDCTKFGNLLFIAT